jgi:hypothetical protein
MSEKTTLNTFIERAKNVHGEKYDYKKVDYKTTETKVIIICKEHGEFLMRPRAHYADKRGCPKCDRSGKSGFHKSEWYDKPKFIYLIEFVGNGERFLKFGVTVNGVKYRVLKGQIPYSYETLFEKKISNGEDPGDILTEFDNGVFLNIKLPPTEVKFPRDSILLLSKFKLPPTEVKFPRSSILVPYKLKSPPTEVRFPRD